MYPSHAAVPTDIDRCQRLNNPSYLNLALSIFILVGILISYLPQHYRIIARRTSEGISPYFVLLGTTSSICAFANIMNLPTSRADAACCKTISTFGCAASLLGIAQIGVQWLCFTIILVLFLVFFPRGSTTPSHGEQKHTWQTAVIVGTICLLHAIVVIIISTGFMVFRAQDLGKWANFLGLLATGLAAIQYIPQISMTWSLGHVGSLSIPMMLIQTPGSFAWAGSLAARLGISGWSTWGVLLVTGCLQGCLLMMGLYFEVRARNVKKDQLGILQRELIETDDEGGPVGQESPELSERTHLLVGTSRESSGKNLQLT